MSIGITSRCYKAGKTKTNRNNDVFFVHAIRKGGRRGVHTKRITIPTLDVKANIEVVGKDKQGRMDVPKQTDQVAWYKYGAKAGQTGNVVLAGHLDDQEGPAVFYDLAKMKKGQRIEVTGKAGQQYRTW